MKKLRRHGIGDVDAANRFLDTVYWADHNRRFAQAPASADDFHVGVPRGLRLADVFRLQETRTVSNDWVVRYDNRLLQIERQSGHPPARSTVLVYEAIDGQLEIRYRGRVMRSTELTSMAGPDTKDRPPSGRPAARPVPVRKPRHIPGGDHPWRKRIEHNLAQPGPPIWQVMNR